MQPLITMYESERLDRWEVLFSRYGVWAAFLNENDRANNIISPRKRKDLYNSWGNTVPIITIQGDALSIGSTYSCTIADQENTSQKVTPTFTEFAWGWNMYPGQYSTGEQAINYVNPQDDFTHKANEYLLALLATVDTTSANILETNRNQFWATNINNYPMTVVANALQISASVKTDAFNQLASVCLELDLYESSTIIGTTSLGPLTRRLEAQGEGNAINERFQFMLGAFTFTSSNRVTNGTNINATGYIVQPGSIATFNRNAPDFRNHEKIGGGSTPVVEWNELMLPRLNMVVGTFYKAACAASPSATSYLAQALQATLQEGFGFNTEIGWLTPYNSSVTTKVTPIVKFEISNT